MIRVGYLRTFKHINQIRNFPSKSSTNEVIRVFSTKNEHNDNDKSNSFLQKYLMGKLVSRKFESLILSSGLITDKDLANILSQTSTIALYSIAAITALGTLGVDTKPFLTGVGVTGFAAGFALKEIATNYLSGLLLVFSKPFHQGQYLKVLSGSGLEGEVESIDIRYVILKTKDQGKIMIPSAVVYSNPILVSTPPSTANQK